LRLVKESTGKNVVFACLLLLIITIFLTACTNKQNTKPKPPEEKEKQDEPLPEEKIDWVLPITPPEGAFYKVAGWLSERQLLYITNQEQTSSVYQYELYTGKSVLLYKSDQPIVTVQISDSKKYILVQTSPSSYEGMITIINQNGTELFEQSLASVELTFEWNPYKESEILVAAFNEDWTYRMYLLDIVDKRAEELSLPQPFIKWISENQIGFLEWEEASFSLYAPLMSMNLNDMTEKPILPEVYQFSTFQDLLMAVTVDKENQSQSTYTFFDNENEPFYSFSMPLLSVFSGWLVPYYDYNQKEGRFVTLQPLSSGDADAYSEGFQLISYDIKKESSEVIMEEMKNAPVSFSPSGDALLYGNRLEKVIDLEKKEIYELVKE
jgi:hypothetical protein